MTTIVVDASAAVEILLNTATGQSLQAAIPAGSVEWVPEIYYIEVAGALRRAELKGLITAQRAAVALDLLLANLVFRVDGRRSPWSNGE